MKKLLSIGLGLSLAFGAAAQIPTFKSFTATGSTNASILIPYSPNSQIRLVSAIESSDLASSQLLLFTGGTSYYVTATNGGIGTNLVLNATNGLTTSSILAIHTPATNFVFTNNSLSSNGPGFANAFPTNVPANSEVEILTLGPTLGVGANVYKVYASDGLYVGPYGRDMWAVLNGTSYATNVLTVHYDASGQ